MLQSLQILQLVLQAAVLVLVIVAVHLHSWVTIELKSFEPSSIDDSPATQLTFAPGGYCLHLINGSSECQPFLHAILEHSRQPDDWRTGPAPLDVLPSLLEGENAINQDFVVAQALSCWCHTRGELTWYLQGAQNVACLVVLETVKYAMAIWGFFASVSLGLSSMFFPRNFIACHAFSSFTSALLGLLVVVAWWYYSSTYIDREYLDELSLHWHHGASYHCALVAFALATANAQIAFDTTGSIGTQKFSRRFIRPTSRIDQDEDWDPLSCPANYLV
jgi:hypothetical protein